MQMFLPINRLLMLIVLFAKALIIKLILMMEQAIS